MVSREIPRNQWRQELDALSREREGWTVSVAVTESGNTRTEARDVPFYGVSVDDPRGDAIAVIVGHEPGDHVAHEVAHPVNVSIESDGHAERALRIRGDDGSTTIVQFEAPPSQSER